MVYRVPREARYLAAVGVPVDDPDYFGIWWTGFALTGKGANKKVWGGTSYDPD